MATSEYGGLILGVRTGGLQDKPAQVSQCRALMSNLNHLADERSRVILNYASDPNAGKVGIQQPRAAPVLFVGGLEWIQILTIPGSCIQPLVGDDGRVYPVRWRLGGRSIAGATSRLGVSYMGTFARTVSFTDATDQWRAPDVSPELIDVGVIASTSPQSIVNTVTPPGDIISINQVTGVDYTIWGYSTTVGNVWLDRAYIAEYVGL